MNFIILAKQKCQMGPIARSQIQLIMAYSLLFADGWSNSLAGSYVQRWFVGAWKSLSGAYNDGSVCCSVVVTGSGSRVFICSIYGWFSHTALHTICKDYYGCLFESIDRGVTSHDGTRFESESSLSRSSALGLTRARCCGLLIVLSARRVSR